jgi:hypothetical protein
VCALVAGAFLVENLAGREDPAQAVIRHALHAWKQDGVLHVAFTETGYDRPKPLRLETWSYTDPATGTRFERDVHPGPGQGTLYPVGEFATTTKHGDEHHSDYDPRTHTITRFTVHLGNFRHMPIDEFTTPDRLKALLERPGAHVTTTSVHGIPAYTISPGADPGDPLAGTTLTFARSDYRLLELRSPGGSTTYRTFEILRPTPANLELTRLSDAHSRSSK